MDPAPTGRRAAESYSATISPAWLADGCRLVRRPRFRRPGRLVLLCVPSRRPVPERLRVALPRVERSRSAPRLGVDPPPLPPDTFRFAMTRVRRRDQFGTRPPPGGPRRLPNRRVIVALAMTSSTRPRTLVREWVARPRPSPRRADPVRRGVGTEGVRGCDRGTSFCGGRRSCHLGTRRVPASGAAARIARRRHADRVRRRGA